MTPTYQTIFESGEGDCLAACIASIFDIPIGIIPDVTEEDWEHQTAIWLQANLGISCILLDARNLPDWCITGYTIGIKRGAGDWNHAVVCLDGKQVHCPDNQHPCPVDKPCTHYLIFTMPKPCKVA